MSDLAKPTVHLNGTSRTALHESYEAAERAVFKAIDEIQNVELNARDYYVQGPEAFKLAREQHEARVRKLIEVRAELLEIVEWLEP